MSKSGAVWHKALLKMLDKNEKLRYNIKVSLPHAGVMELADVADSKSAGSDTVPVRLRPAAPKEKSCRKTGFFFQCDKN